MPPHSPVLALGLLFSLLLAVGQAQELPRPAPEPTVASLQAQIDQLKRGQEELLQQLTEIKALLQQKDRRTEVPIPVKPNPMEDFTLAVEGEPFRGDPRSTVAIIEYSDFDCSYCARFAQEIFPKLDTHYIQAAKVRFFFRDLPSPEHTNALFKARLARCAGEQGKFWEMHERLFADQAVWTKDNVQTEAEAIGLDATALAQCLESNRYAENIRRSVESARALDIHGTPAFLVGTVSSDDRSVRVKKLLLGAESYDGFKTILDALLAPPSAKASSQDKRTSGP